MLRLWLSSGLLRHAVRENFPYLKPISRARLTHRPHDGGRKHLWNVGKRLPDYTTQHPRRQPSSYSPSWGPEISLSLSVALGFVNSTEHSFHWDLRFSRWWGYQWWSSGLWSRVDRLVPTYLYVHMVSQLTRPPRTQFSLIRKQNSG
jgi:hypothetical protein